MANASFQFVKDEHSDAKRVYAFGNTNLFQGGVEFQITDAIVGNYLVNGTATNHAAERSHVVFKTSLGNDPDSYLPLSRILRGKRVLYDGVRPEPRVIKLAPFGDELRQFLVEKLGVDDQGCFKATPEVVATTAKQWFDGKTVQCVDCSGFTKDLTTGRLTPSPCAQFKIKGAE